MSAYDILLICFSVGMLSMFIGFATALVICAWRAR